MKCSRTPSQPSSTAGHRTAADRAYYTIFHAVRATLYLEDLETPKTHAGLHHAFGQHLILSGKLPKELGRSLRRAFRVRQQSDYEVYASPSKQIVANTVEQAEVFLKAIEDYVRQKRGQRQ